MVDQVAAAMGKDPLRVPARRSSSDDRMQGRARQGRQGRQAGGARCRRAPPRASRSTTSTRATRRAWSRSTAGRRPSTGRSRTRYTGPRVTKVVFAVDVGLPINPLGLKAQMMGGVMDGIAQALTYSLHLQGRPLPRGQLGQRATTRASGTCRPTCEVIVMPRDDRRAGRRRRVRRGRRRWPRSRAPTRRATGKMPTQFPINHDAAARLRRRCPTVPPIPQSPTDGLEPRRAEGASDADAHASSSTASRSASTSTTTSACSGCCATSSASPARSTAAASTSARPARATSTARRSTRARCRSSDIKATDEITTIEGLPATVGEDLHPMQEAWLDIDVAQCGYCQPGQIMAAVALVNEATAAGRDGHRRRPRRAPQHLPLRHLPPHPRGDRGRRRPDVRTGGRAQPTG